MTATFSLGMSVQNLLLPLSPFEEYMLCEDNPTHPMNFFLRLKLTGPGDPAAFDAALASAVARHPLLAATVEQVGRQGLFWKSLPDHIPTVKWRVAPCAGEQLGTSHIDLLKQPGLAVIGCQSAHDLELLFQFHHACCDAIGGIQLVEDLLLAYDQAVRGTDKPCPSTWRRIDAACLANRATFGLTPWQLLGKIKQQAVGLIGAWQFLTRTPVQLISSAPAVALAEESQTFPAAYTYDFSAAVTASLLAQAGAAGTTLNNLLIRDLLLAIGDFRNSCHSRGDRQWLRLSIPINLRRAADDNLSAANLVSMVFIDRQPDDLHDQESLLHGIHGQMQQIKDLELGLTFPLSLRFFRGIPGASQRMRRMSSDPRCRCTTVLSNLMRPLSETPLPHRDGKLAVGDCELTGIEFLPPVRQGTQAAFGVLTYADRLNITLHYDPRSMASADAQELLSLYTRYLIQPSERPA